MNEEESITWEQLIYYRQHGWLICGPYLCDLVVAGPPPPGPAQKKKYWWKNKNQSGGAG